MYPLTRFSPAIHPGRRQLRSLPLDTNAGGYTPQQTERLRVIHERVTQARRELDALIGDAYLRPRASIVPVHFLDLASAVEKLRWAEKEWRELDRELAEARGMESGDSGGGEPSEEDDADTEPEPELSSSTAR